ncbi:DegT/DnrJ/EryC1/StrS family aminotransferase [Candidatus Reidiella endopervernicosa]|uniref:DegT/DnrJ/EryC1/StrS family aminotransferase n=1 Tax=Candidatus Reidiella endopervernicosa TaxID=2738883 RepID=A0A6N0HV46_9GAMM|nr:DegT/DnrJ/EryC1/StrS family aminotransferase [Candidatus Reidiella endopervernicosa]QKQ26218.1 DegT/DnrJ/EryC1/StrS family aminotransferase [Candidatus Reidiella endopervernicosa]
MGLDLSASKENLYALIKSNKYSVLLVIHYFGFCQNNMEEISALCKEHGVVLIEDCAHTMFGYCSGVRLGSIGDFSIFSVHKILSVENGGILQVNSSEYLDLINKVKLDGLYCDVLGEVLMSDLECVRSKRRDNYCALMNVLVEFDGIEMMYPDLPEGVSPHNMPIIIRRGRREEVYFKLIDLGIPVVALYYRMISAISAEVFKDSIYLSENILNLPVHQDVDSDDVISVREAFRKIYG